MSASVDELRAIADEVVAERPDWTAGGVLNSLIAVRERGGVEEIRGAAMKAAKHPESRTPSAIQFPSHWNVRRPTPNLAGRTRPLPECRSCGQPVERGQSAWTRACPSCGEFWDPVVFGEEGRGVAVPPPPEFRDALRSFRLKVVDR